MNIRWYFTGNNKQKQKKNFLLHLNSYNLHIYKIDEKQQQDANINKDLNDSMF